MKAIKARIEYSDGTYNDISYRELLLIRESINFYMYSKMKDLLYKSKLLYKEDLLDEKDSKEIEEVENLQKLIDKLIIIFNKSLGAIED